MQVTLDMAREPQWSLRLLQFTCFACAKCYTSSQASKSDVLVKRPCLSMLITCDSTCHCTHVCAAAAPAQGCDCTVKDNLPALDLLTLFDLPSHGEQQGTALTKD